jgi:hypothetical protein
MPFTGLSCCNWRRAEWISTRLSWLGGLWRSYVVFSRAGLWTYLWVITRLCWLLMVWRFICSARILIRLILRELAAVDRVLVDSIADKLPEDVDWDRLEW